MRRVLAVVAACLVGACAEPIGLEPAPVRLAATQIWTGDTLRFISPDFHVNVKRRALIGEDTVTLQRDNDSTMFVVLQAIGRHDVAMLSPLRPLGAVTVFGWSLTR